MTIGRDLLAQEIARLLNIEYVFTWKFPFGKKATTKEILKSYEFKQFKKRYPLIATNVEFGYAVIKK